MSFKAISVVATIFSVLALALLIVRRGLFSPMPFVIAIQVLAALLMIWARITFGARSFHFSANPTEGGLVTNGPYRFIRHPIYSAVAVFTAAGVAGNLSAVNGALGLMVVGGMVLRALCEERLLRERYRDYVQYSRQTWRMIPFIF